MRLDETHDPQLRSWIGSANDATSDFPVQNLPLGVFRRVGDSLARVGVAIGDQILDLTAAADARAWSAAAVDGLTQQTLAAAAVAPLNALMALGSEAWHGLRMALSRALRTGSSLQSTLQTCLYEQRRAAMLLPVRVGDFTDFYTSIHHAISVGSLFRPDAPLLPNYRWTPLAYHARSSSLCVSGTPVTRPRGQWVRAGTETPVLAASERLDFELELGAYIGTGNRLGTSIDLKDAESHVFGMCLLNDWSARDIQSWEYRPLGPFLGKSFATTLSPWIVTLEALAPFRAPWSRPDEDPPPLPYLDSTSQRQRGAFAVDLEVWLETERMRAAHAHSVRLASSNWRHAYWTLAQMVTHHTINGCNLQTGDLLGTGTLSGPQAEQGGCLMELTRGGSRPLTLSDGERRAYLEDGDAITLRARCRREGAAALGFGECRAQLLPNSR